MSQSPAARPPLLPTLLVSAAVILLMFLAANAAFRFLTMIVELVLVVVVLAIMARVGLYLWRRGRAV